MRADLIIHWADNSCCHIEVKVGDNNLEKTRETGEKIRIDLNIAKEQWRDYLLILPHQESDWQYELEKNPSNKSIHLLSWEEVCIYLRKAISSCSVMLWKSFAYSYIGCVEQKLLNLNLASKVNHKSLHHIQDQTTILENYMIDE